MKIKIGTRGSELALIQANLVKEQLENYNYESEIIVIKTKGDEILDKPLYKVGDKGLFTAELENALKAREIEIAVHSLKDLPTKISEELPLIAITKREEPWDCFIFAERFSNLKSYKNLPEGSLIGTSSLRRIVQLKTLRPDFRFLPLRGNVNSRINKINNGQENLAAGVLAVAGLKRLGLNNFIHEVLPLKNYLPAAGQGALAVQTNLKLIQEKEEIAKILKKLNHQETYLITATERAALEAVDGGCQTPFGAYGEILDNKKLKLQAFIGNKDCSAIYRAEEIGLITDFRKIGSNLGEKLKIAG